MKILPEMDLWTRKSLLIFGSHPDTGIFWRIFGQCGIGEIRQILLITLEIVDKFMTLFEELDVSLQQTIRYWYWYGSRSIARFFASNSTNNNDYNASEMSCLGRRLRCLTEFSCYVTLLMAELVSRLRFLTAKTLPLSNDILRTPDN